VQRARCGRDFSANQADAYGYASAGEARPNAVSQVRLANGSLRRYGYDASGNLVCQTDDAQSGSCDQWPQFEAYYNHNQQPSYQRRKASGSGANAQYAESWYSYGADQQPARQWGIERIEGCTLDSLGCLRHHRIHLDRYEDSVGTLRHIDGRARQARTRAYIGDYLVATRGDAGQLELSYLLRDRLGSVVGVEQVTLSDRRISGLTPETRHAFDAFGAPRSNRWWSANRWHDIGTWYSPTRTQQGFTGHERLSGLQLIHMRGRVFDPVLGRFHGVDPIIQFPLSSQGLNPYSYLLNNPMAGVDPTGYAACGARIKDGEICEISVTTRQAPTGSRIVQTETRTFTVGANGASLFFVAGSGNSVRSQVSQAIADSGSVGNRPHAQSTACLSWCHGNEGAGSTESASADNEALDLATSLGPITGILASTYELAYGRTYFAGEEASRPWAAFGLLTLGLGKYLQKADGFVDLYHGTSSAGARSIRENGVDLSFSRQSLDFGAGFYTTTDFDQAKRWAARVAGGGEVLHFRVPIAELNRFSVLSLERSDSFWQSFVQWNREGRGFHGYDVVNGPMLGNPKSFLRGQSAESWGQQTSFHTQSVVDLLNESLVR
jgi:RHS repeat-associated protein